jgi:hypothetical protein
VNPTRNSVLSYSNFEKLINKTVEAASETACHEFAIDTIRLLEIRAREAIESELTKSHRTLLKGILSKLAEMDPKAITTTIDNIYGTLEADEEGSVELDAHLRELVSAIESYALYRDTADRSAVFAVAIANVNSIDFEISDEEYSLENMLGSPLMASELERQQRLLGPHS